MRIATPAAPRPAPRAPRPLRRRPSMLRRLLACALLVPLLACERGEQLTVTTTPNGSRLELPAGVEPVPFPAGTAEIHAGGQVHTLRIEIAETDAQRERGLMFRTSMPEEAGMLFVYPEPIRGGFWMYNTRIALSIAYADSAATVAQITEMQPCPSEFATLCPSYPAQQPFQYALEVNQGYFARRGIGPGARITWRRE
jgi:uncharacterized protein